MQINQSSSVYKNFKYRVTADLLCLRLARTGFKYKVLWKRRQNKAQTRVIQHNQTQSFINQRLTLDFNMQFDTRKGKFLEKSIDFLPTIVTEAGLRSGGYGRIDLAEVLNFGQTRVEKIIPLAQCPDPNATIQVTLQYVNMGQTDRVQDSVILNSSMDIESSNPKQKTDKFRTTSPPHLPPMSPRAVLNTSDDQSSRIIQQLQAKLHTYQNRQKQLVAENSKYIADLQQIQKTHQAKDLQLNNKSREIIPLRQAQKQLQRVESELRQKQKTIQMLNLQLVQAAKQSTQGRVISRNFSSEDEHKRIEQLEKLNNQLQGQLSLSSMKLAQIFNAAVEIGGPNLLDTLQHSIGMND